jgi:hypothetical protein
VHQPSVLRPYGVRERNNQQRSSKLVCNLNHGVMISLRPINPEFSCHLQGERMGSLKARQEGAVRINIEILSLRAVSDVEIILGHLRRIIDAHDRQGPDLEESAVTVFLVTPVSHP